MYPPAQKQLLTQIAACNGEEAVSQRYASKPTPTEIHFKVSQQDITLTINTRLKFFRKRYSADIVLRPGPRQAVVEYSSSQRRGPGGIIRRSSLLLVNLLRGGRPPRRTTSATSSAASRAGSSRPRRSSSSRRKRYRGRKSRISNPAP